MDCLILQVLWLNLILGLGHRMLVWKLKIGTHLVTTCSYTLQYDGEYHQLFIRVLRHKNYFIQTALKFSDHSQHYSQSYLNMPNIVCKKTFKIKPSGFQVSNQKSFSFHGASVPSAIIVAINQRLAKMPRTQVSNVLTFKANNLKQYYAEMNHAFQKYHEEDAVACVLDVMDEHGWIFCFQHDTASSSTKVTWSSETSCELFVFHKWTNEGTKNCWW